MGRVKEETIKGLFVKVFNRLYKDWTKLFGEYKQRLEREKFTEFGQERIGILNEEIRSLIQQERALILIEEKGYAVCAYARVSTDDEDQLSSYQAQVEHYTSYIKNNPA